VPMVITHPMRTPDKCIMHDGPRARSWTRSPDMPRNTKSRHDTPEVQMAVSVAGSASSLSIQLARGSAWSMLTAPGSSDV